MHVREHFSTARAFFETDVERRKGKIQKFEKKYKVRIRPRKDFEDMIRSIELEKEEKDKVAN